MSLGRRSLWGKGKSGYGKAWGIFEPPILNPIPRAKEIIKTRNYITWAFFFNLSFLD